MEVSLGTAEPSTDDLVHENRASSAPFFQKAGKNWVDVWVEVCCRRWTGESNGHGEESGGGCWNRHGVRAC